MKNSKSITGEYLKILMDRQAERGRYKRAMTGS